MINKQKAKALAYEEQQPFFALQVYFDNSEGLLLAAQNSQKILVILISNDLKNYEILAIQETEKLKTTRNPTFYCQWLLCHFNS